MSEPTVRERLRGTPDCCPFCGNDPYHYVDNGVGMERVAVTCCDEGIAYIQYGDPALTKMMNLRREAADLIDALVEALDLYNSAIRVDVLMEGPQFGGVNHTAMKRAWQHGRAVLARAKGEPK